MTCLTYFKFLKILSCPLIEGKIITPVQIDGNDYFLYS